MQRKPLKNSDPVSLSQLSQRGSIGKILNKVQFLQSVNSKLYTILPKELRPFCRAINITGFQLVLACSRPDIANSIYYQQSSLLKQLQQAECSRSFNRLHIKVCPGIIG
jgi:hypothetical protein